MESGGWCMSGSAALLFVRNLGRLLALELAKELVERRNRAWGLVEVGLCWGSGFKMGIEMSLVSASSSCLSTSYPYFFGLTHFFITASASLPLFLNVTELSYFASGTPRLRDKSRFNCSMRSNN